RPRLRSYAARAARPFPWEAEVSTAPVLLDPSDPAATAYHEAGHGGVALLHRIRVQYLEHHRPAGQRRTPRCVPRTPGGGPGEAGHNRVIAERSGREPPGCGTAGRYTRAASSTPKSFSYSAFPRPSARSAARATTGRRSCTTAASSSADRFWYK